MAKRVYLSPSLQEKNIGAGDYGTEEKRMNEIADVVQRELVRCGCEVFRNDPGWTLQQVKQHADRLNVDCYVAVHSNAGGGQAYGCEVYAYAANTKSESLAYHIYKRIEALTSVVDRGVKYNAKLYEVGQPNATSCLIEVDFHDNPERAAWIIANIKPIGIEIAKGICEYLGIAYITSLGLLGAVDKLVKHGVISSPDYWKENAVKGKTVNGEWIGLLIERIAKLLE